MYDAPFGDSAKGPVRKLVIGSEPGLVLELLDLGATVHALWATDPHGVRRNLVLGLPTPAAYLDSTDYVGATVGRFANRIAGASFELDGRRVQLDANEGPTSVHGGPDAFHRRIWNVVAHADDEVVLRLVSPDGDQGFPGELTATASYAVTADSLRIVLEATTDAPTLANLTSHVYWNLDGADSIDGHVLRVDAASYLPTDDVGIPTGIEPVYGERDLRTAVPVGERRLDHCFVLDGSSSLGAGGIELELTTDRPGLQVYTGDGLRGRPRGGIALEPQLFPDAPHHPEFPSAVLRPGETSRTTIEWRIR